MCEEGGVRRGGGGGACGRIYIHVYRAFLDH